MTEFTRTLIQLIHDANPSRNISNIGRRIIKLGEEFGEVSEAYLNVTSAGNGKEMAWSDVREELADTFIVAVDVALTVFTDEETVEALVETLVNQGGGFITGELERDILILQANIGSLAFMKNVGPELRDEANDLVALTLEMCTRRLPDQLNVTQEYIDADLKAVIECKLAKWKRNRDTGTAATDAE